ncbi:hypothetical protein DPX16_1398 [Anabarilius grahami]|uniref:Uncharacterized protein n=1 Tax=Anabarilius grahami TaxID=495550 RepID=A0A3N0XDS4_ANAGA|nr:hypothetical protein DPX16_1398 [Anabarilius grahami]
MSLCEEQGKQHETHEVLASCSDAEPSDSSSCGQPLNKQIIQCAENSHGNNLVVIEETQTHSVEAVSRMEHEDDMRLRTDNYLPNKSNFVPPQGGDISIQNEIQQTDSDIGSMDLFSPLNSQEHKNNQIHKTASITANIEESDQDSDVTQIETEGQSESIFGPGTPRWYDGEHQAQEDDESDITQIETEGEYVSVFGPRTPTKQFTIQDVNTTKLSESQKTGQSSVVLHTELFSRKEDKTRHKKKKTKSSSHKDTEVTGIEETVNVQPSSKHLPLADEPLREVYSSSCEHVIVGKQRRMVEMETDTQDSPLFKIGGMSFLKRKRKGKKKMGAAILMECDTNVDASQKVSSEFQVDVAELKTTCKENRELFDVENRVTNEEQTAASVLQSEETSELLEEMILSTFADSSVIKKAKKKKIKMYKLKEREDAEPGVENQSVEAVQFNEPQTNELTLIRTKKRRKDKERTKTAYVEENSATDIPSNGTLDSDRPTELRVNEGDLSSESPEAGQPKHMQTSEEIAGSLLPNVTRLKSVKKKKKKRDETESQYESVDLNVSSMSQFDTGLRVVELQYDQVIEERRSNDSAAEHLEDNTASLLKVAKRKKKSPNVSSPSQSDDIIGLEKQVSCMQSENTAEPNNLGPDDIVITKDKKKKAKKQKLKERRTIELASDIKDIVQIQYSESQTTDLLSRRTKKKRANKDRGRTVSSSNEHLEHMDDRPPEIRGIIAIQSNEATETDQIEHLQSSEGITRYKSPSVTILSSGKKKKKKKKKRDQSEERQYESVDLILDVSSVSQFDVTALRGQKMIKRRQSDAAENLEGNAAHILNVAKRKKKSQNASAPSQIVDIIRLENAVSDSQSGNTAELVEKTNSSGLSDNTLSTKYKRNKKKKHKLKEQEVAEPNAVTHSVDNVHSVEMDQFNESQTTELTLKRTKKKRKDKERKKTAYIEENGTTDSLAIETFETIETNHLEHLQTSEQTEQCPSPNVTRLKSVKKKKKKKNGSEECQYESVDFALGVSLVSQFDNVTHRSNTQQTVEESPNDVEYLESNTEAKLNDTKHKKKRKRSSFSFNYNSDFNFSAAQMQETVTPERKMKKKRF